MGFLCRGFLAVFLLLVVTVDFSSSQSLRDGKANIMIKEKWTPGKVVLTDNTVYKGLIDFQENFDLVKVKTGEEIKTFTPRQVKNFSIYDPRNRYRRFFVSIPYASHSKSPALVFFEVLKETKDVALLSRQFNLNKELVEDIGGNSIPFFIPYGPDAVPGSFGPSTSLILKPGTCRETLYLANDEGFIAPFVIISHETREEDKSKLLNRSLMREFLGKRYKECKEFASQYALDLKNKEDLMALLEYYERIGN